MTKEIYKPKPISGFPEWLPGYRRVEQRWMDHMRKTFESYGFTNIETPAVEDVNVLQAKGEITKEIYALHRHAADVIDKDDARLALHFDLTVPMARYVAQHFNDLEFPFKRYAMQKVWRGERPQKGRMREFYQCDIDVIGVDGLPLHFDAEIPAVIHEVFEGIGIGRTQIRISNRKILSGLMESGGLSDTLAAIQTVDKLEKIGEEKVAEELVTLGASENLAADILALVTMRDVHAITPQGVMMEEGLHELAFVINNLGHLPEHAVMADLSIARGLDYYTGTVYETRLLDVPEFTGSVCSGGRYDDLAGRFINRHLPGVGISIGLTRLFDVLMQHGKITPLAPCPTDILVVLPSDELRSLANRTAHALRGHGHNVEVYHAPKKIGQQIAYAEKKHIPFVWFIPFEDGHSHEIKNLDTGEQMPANPASWHKP